MGEWVCTEESLVLPALKKRSHDPFDPAATSQFFGGVKTPRGSHWEEESPSISVTPSLHDHRPDKFTPENRGIDVDSTRRQADHSLSSLTWRMGQLCMHAALIPMPANSTLSPIGKRSSSSIKTPGRLAGHKLNRCPDNHPRMCSDVVRNQDREHLHSSCMSGTKLASV